MRRHSMKFEVELIHTVFKRHHHALFIPSYNHFSSCVKSSRIDRGPKETTFIWKIQTFDCIAFLGNDVL